MPFWLDFSSDVLLWSWSLGRNLSTGLSNDDVLLSFLFEYEVLAGIFFWLYLSFVFLCDSCITTSGSIVGYYLSWLLFNTAQSETYARIWSSIILSFMSLGFILQGRISFSHLAVSTCTTFTWFLSFLGALLLETQTLLAVPMRFSFQQLMFSYCTQQHSAPWQWSFLALFIHVILPKKKVNSLSSRYLLSVSQLEVHIGNKNLQ